MYRITDLTGSIQSPADCFGSSVYHTGMVGTDGECRCTIEIGDDRPRVYAIDARAQTARFAVAIGPPAIHPTIGEERAGVVPTSSEISNAK